MAAEHGKKYRPWDPEEFATHPYTAADKLPEDDLVFFLLDVIPHLDLSRFYASYEVEKRGAPPTSAPSATSARNTSGCCPTSSTKS